MRYTEDEVRSHAHAVLGFCNVDTKEARCDVGQLTTFRQLGFTEKKSNHKPDGWYLPTLCSKVAVILEMKNSEIDLSCQSCIDELLKNVEIAHQKYKNVVGILYNGICTVVYKNDVRFSTDIELQNINYYTRLFDEDMLDTNKIYNLTRQINDCLHSKFGIKDLYHRMVFTACALVAKRYGAMLVKDMDYSTFHTAIHSTLAKSFEEDKKQNSKLDILLEVYSEIKMNNTNNQEAINHFIEWVSEISDSINSDNWRGEDVMGIFFNEFNRYKSKSDSGQVFTPGHITSLMYRLIEVNKDDIILDAACGSGAFLVKSMSNMIQEAGGVSTAKAKEIKSRQLYGIEFDRQIFALACANMLIHKDGKTNLTHDDTRSDNACTWIRSKKITKVLMNPPFERKYGCLTIVKNVLDNVPPHTLCAFILPDKKLEKDSKKTVKDILAHHRLKKIIKLPEKTFLEGVTTSVFIWETGIPQNNEQIFACYIEDDGLGTVKNQGRQDIYGKWQGIEDKWVDIIKKQSGSDTILWLKPEEHLSYQVPSKKFEIFEEDFNKTMMDYLMFKEGIDVKELGEKIITRAFYGIDDFKQENNNA